MYGSCWIPESILLFLSQHVACCDGDEHVQDTARIGCHASDMG